MLLCICVLKIHCCSTTNKNILCNNYHQLLSTKQQHQHRRQAPLFLKRSTVYRCDRLFRVDIAYMCCLRLHSCAIVMITQHIYMKICGPYIYNYYKSLQYLLAWSGSSLSLMKFICLEKFLWRTIFRQKKTKKPESQTKISLLTCVRCVTPQTVCTQETTQNINKNTQ